MTMTLNGTTGIVLPAAAAPAFSAGRTANQTPSANTWTKVQYNVEDFDTNNNYDSSTNYRFTPTVAGYYQISFVWNNTSGSTYNYAQIYKNGTGYKLMVSSGASGSGAGLSFLIYFNGSTDYVEAYVFTDTGSIAANNGGFTGVMVRSA